MAAAISFRFFSPIPTTSAALRRPYAGKSAGIITTPSRNRRWRLRPAASRARSSLVKEQSPAAVVDGERLVEFLKADLPHLFDDVGIDRSMYDDRVRFRDPITRHDTIDGYLFNIKLLKVLFNPEFFLHHVKQTAPYEFTTRWTMVMKFVLLPWKPELVFTGISIMGVNPETQKFCSHVDIWDSIENNEYFSFEGLWDVLKQTAPYEITTRWTMVMKFVLLPWKPELVFTGISIMGVNPETQKFCSHVDIWDSIENNEYFSFEGLWDVLKQLRIYKKPDIETLKYKKLKRTANYEVRSYEPFLIVEAKGDKLSGSSGFTNVTGYIFGKNSSSEKIPMTTPVFTRASDDKFSDVSIQIVLPKDKELGSLPAPTTEEVNLRKVEGGIAAVKKFSGRPTEEDVLQIEKELRSRLIKDGLKPQQGCVFARYNDPRTQSFIMRNEVLIWLRDFTLE